MRILGCGYAWLVKKFSSNKFLHNNSNISTFSGGSMFLLPLIMISFKLIQPAVNICIGIGTADLIANIFVYLQYSKLWYRYNPGMYLSPWSNNGLWEYKNFYPNHRSISAHFNCSFMQHINHSCTVVEHIHLIKFILAHQLLHTFIPEFLSTAHIFKSLLTDSYFNGVTLTYHTFTCVSSVV